MSEEEVTIIIRIGSQMQNSSPKNHKTKLKAPYQLLTIHIDIKQCKMCRGAAYSTICNLFQENETSHKLVNFTMVHLKHLAFCLSLKITTRYF